MTNQWTLLVRRGSEPPVTIHFFQPQKYLEPVTVTHRGFSIYKIIATSSRSPLPHTVYDILTRLKSIIKRVLIPSMVQSLFDTLLVSANVNSI